MTNEKNWELIKHLQNQIDSMLILQKSIEIEVTKLKDHLVAIDDRFSASQASLILRMMENDEKLGCL